MLEALSLPFMQRALLAGLLIAFTTSYFGVFVVQRSLAFMGSGLAHAAFGGVALGLLLEHEPLWIAVPFTIIVAILITWVRDHTRLAADTVIGVFFAFAMALGIVFLSMRTSYSADAFTYLFGSILAVQAIDLWFAGLVALLTLLSIPLWSRWAYATFDREAARADGLNVLAHDYLLAIAIAVAVVVAVKVIGIVLLSAFLVIPAAAARLLANRFASMTTFAVGLSLLTVVAGVLASYEFDIPTGATIILAQVAAFALALLTSIALRRQRIRRARQMTP